MGGCGRAENGDVWLRGFETLAIVGEGAGIGNGKVALHRCHTRWLFITDTHDFHIWVVVRLPQQIAHVHMIEVDAHYFKFLHKFAPYQAAACAGTGGTC